MLIRPHGGTLVNRVFNQQESSRWQSKTADLPTLRVSKETLRDVENIAKGVYSPVEGFVGVEDYDSILYKMRLADGTPWTIPLLLDVDRDTADGLEEGSVIGLTGEDGTVYSLLHLESKYVYNKEELAKQVFGTTSNEHPAVAKIQSMGEILLSGKVDCLCELPNQFKDVTLDPVESRILFRERGFQTVVAFQTRNVPHIGHEDLQRTVLSLTDGLLVHPVIGKKKPGDFRDEVIIAAYKALIDNYYNPDRAILSILPTEMRYGGPREAIMHSIMRKNYGCTHMVIGRDHAGVGGFYGHDDAINMFDEFPDLEIQPIMIRGDFFHCKKCGCVASDRNCRHTEEDHIPFSGTLIRKMLVEGGTPPKEIFRPEVFEAMRQFDEPFVK